MICPEFRALWAGVEGADSIVFNPHKWLGAQFDCSVQFCADPAPQVRTLGLRPTYLETPGGRDHQFNEWTVPLGRRFRALKLWFLLRAYGLEGLRSGSATMSPGRRSRAADRRDPGDRDRDRAVAVAVHLCAGDDAATEALLARINDDGRIYLTQTRHDGRWPSGWTSPRRVAEATDGLRPMPARLFEAWRRRNRCR
jgi:aromatic-L-amino-acid/L-tryptophan decarboxylase